MFNDFLIAFYTNESDEPLNILKTNLKISTIDIYEFNNHKISFYSPFTNKTIIKQAKITNINIDNSLKNYLSKLLYDSVQDINIYYLNKEINLINNIDLSKMINDVIESFENNFIQYGIYKWLISLQGNIKKHISDKKTSILFFSVFLHNILIFFGYYIKWDVKFTNSFIGFWSEFLNLFFTKNDKIIHNKFEQLLKEHTYLLFLDPIYFDDNTDNKTLDKNIFIEFIFEKIIVNWKDAYEIYLNKTKKIDKNILSIMKEID